MGVTNSLIKTVGARVTGIERGFMGMIERRSRPLDSEAVAGILNQGGTILGTHNFANPFSCNGVDVVGQGDGVCAVSWGWMRWWPSVATAR